MGIGTIARKRSSATATNRVGKSMRKRPVWVESAEEELCPTCFRAVGDKNRYKLICLLGKSPTGVPVRALTRQLKLAQPTVTHHLNVLRSVDAVESERSGREHLYTLKRDAHCFAECKIPFS